MPGPHRNRTRHGFFTRRACAIAALALSAACGRPDRGPRDTTVTSQLSVAINGCTQIAELGQTWCGVDVGGAPAGTSTYESGVFRLVGRGRGLDLPSNQDPNAVDADQMRFVYRALDNDSEIVVKLKTFAGDRRAQAGVMIRAPGAGPTDGHANKGGAFLRLYTVCDDQLINGQVVCVPRLHPNNEAFFAWRTNANLPGFRESGWGVGAEIGPGRPGDAAGADVWFRLQRAGNDFSVSRSTDGRTWIPISSQSGGPIAAGTTANVGFFVSPATETDDPSKSATAEFEQVYSGPLRLEFKSSWAGATYNRDSTGWMASRLNSYYVAPDGTSYTYNAVGPEGSENVSMIRGDGTVQTAWSGTSGVDQGAITGDGTYIYMAGWSPTPCGEGTTCSWIDVFQPNPLRYVVRLGLAPGHPVHLYGIPWVTASSTPVVKIAGIAARTVNGVSRIFISDLGTDLASDADDRIVVIPGGPTPPSPPAQTSFAFSRPGPAAVDSQGRVWIVRGTVAYPIPRNFKLDPTLTGNAVECRTATGTACGSIPRRSANPLTGLENPSAIAAHPTMPRLYLAENGVDQNIRVYDVSGATPTFLTPTFGRSLMTGATPGLAYNAAESGSARFAALNGVGIDSNNNLYVATGPAVDVRKFAPSGSSWSTESLWRQPATGTPRVHGVHTSRDFVVFDPASNGTKMYTARETFDFDPSKPTGTEWGLRARHWNPLTNPDRLTGIPRVATVGGQRYLFVLSGDRAGRTAVRSAGEQQLDIYRLVNEIAVPAMRFTFDNICYTWNQESTCAADSTCLCNFTPNNFSADGDAIVSHGPALMKLWVDKNGDGLVNETPDLLTTPQNEACADVNDEVTCSVDPLGGQVPEQVDLRPASCPPTGGAAECQKPPPPGKIEGYAIGPNGDLWLAFTRNGSYGRVKALWRLSYGTIPGSSVSGYSLTLDATPGLKVYDPPPGMHPDDPAPSAQAPYLTSATQINERYINDLRFDSAGRMFVLATGQSNGRYKVRRYDNWSTGNWTPSPQFQLPLIAHNNVDFIAPTSLVDFDHNYYSAFDVAGDKVFVHEWYGSIYAHSAEDGHRYTRISAGPEISGYQLYNGHKGLAAARNTTTGEYFIASHHAGEIRGRVAVYRWKPSGALGDACSAAGDCNSGFCVDGICCESACAATACSAPHCANLGEQRGVCLGGAPFPDGTACNDNNTCTTSDSCQSGVCVGTSGRGGDNFCASCPCAFGDGDCDSASECQAGLNCVAHVGASFGMSASTDVCVNWDPTCSTGFPANGVCCAASCGSCGGSGCASRPGGGNACCLTNIRNAGVSCTTSGPPCVMSDPECKTGIRSGNVCCAYSCGTCGGTGCSGRPGGSAACCSGTIQAAARSCAENMPPCTLP